MTSGDVVGSVIAKPQDPTRVGTVAELWRYPVKSMLGSMASELFMTRNGAVGDRGWALRDLKSGRIASAKRFPRLLDFRASYEIEPTPETTGRIRIETPDGNSVDPSSRARPRSFRASSGIRCDLRTGRTQTRRRASTSARCSATSPSRQ
jgi:hypothetical protein